MINPKYSSSIDRLPGDDLWAKMANSCTTIEGLSEKEIKDAQDAFRTVKDVLGEHFLDMVFSEDHPIFFNLINMVAYTRRWIIWVANALKGSLIYDQRKVLIKYFKSPDRYHEALSLLKYSDKLHKAGFKIKINPPVGNKIADIQIVNEENDELIIIEVSIQYESVREKEAFKTMIAISRSVIQFTPGITFSGAVYRIMAEKHLSEIINQVQVFAIKAKTENIFSQLSIPHTLDIAIAPNDNNPKLIQWAKERGMQPGDFAGPDAEVNHIHRLEAKVYTEQKQLSTDSPGIIIIEDNNFIFRTSDITEIIAKVENIVYKYNNISLLIISGGFRGRSTDETTKVGDHYYVRVVDNDMSVDQYIIMVNKYCDHPVSQDTFDKIMSSLYM
ncbi:hypothetical protein HZA73_09550 [candidate division TA06 bacterium]|nr:hypothetical protein [candidate division TA06 bacterium]